MKYTKLFEQFIAESKKLDTLIDVLANLEDAFTEEEFVEFGQDVNVDPDTMSKIFKDVSDFVIVIFDNIVIGANDMAQLTDRFRKFIQLCTEHNLHLKIT